MGLELSDLYVQAEENVRALLTLKTAVAGFFVTVLIYTVGECLKARNDSRTRLAGKVILFAAIGFSLILYNIEGTYERQREIAANIESTYVQATSSTTTSSPNATNTQARTNFSSFGPHSRLSWSTADFKKLWMPPLYLMLFALFSVLLGGCLWAKPDWFRFSEDPKTDESAKEPSLNRPTNC